MWNQPGPDTLAKIPKLYATEEQDLKDKLIHLHFFIGGSDWYISEYDGQDIFWGFAILNSDYEMAEWGYIPFSELRSIRLPGGFEIDCDQYWRARPAKEVDKIQKCHAHW